MNKPRLQSEKTLPLLPLGSARGGDIGALGIHKVYVSQRPDAHVPFLWEIVKKTSLMEELGVDGE
jgi:hypothetical protein